LNERTFTIQALENCDLLQLSLQDLDRMREEFPDLYQELYEDGHNRYKQEKKTTKLEIITCISTGTNLKNKFTALLRGNTVYSTSDSDEARSLRRGKTRHGKTRPISGNDLLKRNTQINKSQSFQSIKSLDQLNSGPSDPNSPLKDSNTPSGYKKKADTYFI
jgi:hypothetical protein